MVKDKVLQKAFQSAGFYAGGNKKSDNWKMLAPRNKALQQMKETRNRIKKTKSYGE